MRFQPRSFTFYSYKGGVGRSMALLNMAYALHARGRHVLVVDLDLDAPGASGFLRRTDELLSDDVSGDVVDVLAAVVKTVRETPEGSVLSTPNLRLEAFLRSVDPAKYAVPAHPRTPRARLDILAADELRDYPARLAALELATLSADQIELASNLLRSILFEHRFPFPQPWQEPDDPPEDTFYDYVLVDSRTGLSETGGLCVGPLSDRLIVLCGLNDQNINGTRHFLDLVGLEAKPRPKDAEAWDDADRADTSGNRPPSIGPKPTLLVASPVPGGEIVYKRERIRVLEDQIGLAPVKLSYHPQMALMETLFVRDHPDEYLALEYANLVDRMMSLVRDSSDQLREALNEMFRSASVKESPAADSMELARILNRIALETGQQAMPLTSSNLSSLGIADEDKRLLRRLRINLETNDVDKAWAWLAWGDELDTEDARKRGDQDVLRQICEAYQKAVSLKPDFHEALYNWGVALIDWAETMENDEADALFSQAIEKYEAALAIKSDIHQAFYNWGLILTIRARLKEGAIADALFAEAAEKYKAAIDIKPDYDKALFNLACFAGLRGDAETTVEYLTRWKAANPDSSQSNLDDDADFDRIREDPAFVAFRETLPKS